LTEQAPERGYLLDTHTALFSLWQSRNLSAIAKTAIAEGPNYISVVSYWEVTIKSMKGKLDVGDPRLWWLQALEQLAATPVLLRPEHAAALNDLPPIHQDPFDRILIAQAKVERLALVTRDSDIAQYSTTGIRIVV
jgi:PIN domain nuclease of toxin-antitoxin system